MSAELEQTDELLIALARTLGIEPKESGPLAEDAATDLDQTDIQAIPKAIREAIKRYERTTPPESKRVWQEVIRILNKAADDAEAAIQTALKV